MHFRLTKDEFLSKNRISEEQWEKSACEWDELTEIANDHLANADNLRETAAFFANVIQKLPDVHSVRWRLKDVEHLLEKIIRKRYEKSDKYSDITRENYTDKVTDLVGIRALHLFKDDCFTIHRDVSSLWTQIEKPTAFIRPGDQDEITKRFEEHGFEVKSHPAGYRSVHYVFTTQPMRRKVIVELQVRTIFEEAWSEIDHTMRYPNFSDNPLVAYFLTIFNRLAGSADEMGDFVRGLTRTLTEMEAKVHEANKERDDILEAMDNTLVELEQAKQQSEESRANVEKLRSDIANLRRTSSIEALISGYSTDGMLGSSIDQAYIKRTRNALDILNQFSSTHLNSIRASDIAKLGILGLASDKERS